MYRHSLPQYTVMPRKAGFQKKLRFDLILYNEWTWLSKPQCKSMQDLNCQKKEYGHALCVGNPAYPTDATSHSDDYFTLSSGSGVTLESRFNG